jgi:hypothetical protein
VEPLPPESRSSLNGVDCPWGVDQTAAALTLRQEGVKLDFDCDQVLYKEDLYGSIDPTQPTFDEVKKNYEQSLQALLAHPQFLKAAIDKGRFDHLTFVIDKDSTEISFTKKTLFFSAYGASINATQVIDYMQAILEFDDQHLDGLPVSSKLGKIRITGSDAQTQYTFSTLQSFAQTYAIYKDEFRAAAQAFREVEINERTDDDVDILFRNGVLKMPHTTAKDWAVHDALAVAKSYQGLPADWRNSITMEVDLPDARLPDVARNERVHARALDLLAKKVALIQVKLPNLKTLTLDGCGNLITGPGDSCGSLNSTATGLEIGIFSHDALGAASLVDESVVDAELNRLF